MGDVMSLIEKAQAAVDEEDAAKLNEKIRKASFDFNDYLNSVKQMQNMGGLSGVLNMLPGIGGKVRDIDGMIDEKSMAHNEAIIMSMTPAERENPGLLNPSRKMRIAKGAGLRIDEVNRFVKQFEQARKFMKKMPGMMKNKRRGFGGFGLPF